MLAEAQAALQSLVTIKGIADGLVSMRDETKVLETKLALMGQIFEIRKGLDALQDELSKVKEENRKLKQADLEAKKFADDFSSYALFQVVSSGFVMAPKAEDGARQKPPYCCHSCYREGEKSILSFQRALDRDHPAALVCPVNKNHSIQLPRGADMAWLTRD